MDSEITSTEKYRLKYAEDNREKIKKAVQRGEIEECVALVVGSKEFKIATKEKIERVPSKVYIRYREKDQQPETVFTHRDMASTPHYAVRNGLINDERTFRSFVEDVFLKEYVNDSQSTLLVLILPPLGELALYKKTVETIGEYFPYIAVQSEVGADMFLFKGQKGDDGNAITTTVLDVGHHTQDLQTILHGRPVQVSDKPERLTDSKDVAGLTVDQELRRLIRQQLGIEYDISLSEACRVKEQVIAPIFDRFWRGDTDRVEVDIKTQTGKRTVTLPRDLVLQAHRKLINGCVNLYQDYVNAREFSDVRGEVIAGGLVLTGGIANINGLDTAIASEMPIENFPVRRLTEFNGKSLNPRDVSAVAGRLWGIWMYDLDVEAQ